MVSMKLVLEQPEKALYTIRATMTAEEWVTVRDRLKASKPEHYDGYEPAGKFVAMIDDLLEQAHTVFYPSTRASQSQNSGDE
jgi:hypothetical protein